MKIKMLLTNAFDPDPRVYKEAKTLVDFGHEVEILAWDREGAYKNNKLDWIDGIRIYRFFSSGKYGSGIRQILGYFNYINNVTNYLDDATYDYVHCHDLDTLIVGFILKLKKRKKIKLIYDQHDLFYLYFKNRGGLFNFLISKILKHLEMLLLGIVDKYIVVTPNMKKIYMEKKDSLIITNAPYKNSFKFIEKPIRNKPVIGFIGGVRYYEELKALCDISGKIGNIEVFIAGKGIKLDMLKEYVEKEKYNHIEIYGEYKVYQLEELYKKIDVTYLIYPTESSLVSLPNKFFESIITETPIIADENSEYGQIVKQYNLGWTIDSGNLNRELKKVIEEINTKPEIVSFYKKNMKIVKEDYYWESNIEKLCEIYK